MSAIFGIFQIDGKPVAQEDLESMNAILAHRGPDGSKILVDRNLGLGHRMLWTTPESLTEVLPFKSADGKFVITADARIDNRDQLIGLLGLENRSKEKLSDSEIILASYQKWAEQCPEKLLGDFAFAIWDDRKQSLFCARDHFGVRSFYYYLSRKKFIFGTEIKALLTNRDVPRRLNEVKVADYLLASALQDTEITFYQEILRLSPGHSLKVDRDGKQMRRYWSLDPSREIRLSSDEEYAEAVRELFTEAVRCRMRSAFPMGSMLSGGIDSSSITCMARKLKVESRTNHPWHTFSAVFDQVKECDERFYIDTVLAGNGLKPHFAVADGLSPLSDFGRVLWHHDEAMRAGNLYYGWNLYSQAKQANVRIILDGFDGDSTISHGIGLLSELALKQKWFDLAIELKDFTQHVDDDYWPVVWWRWVDRYKIQPAISRHRITRRVRQTWRHGRRLVAHKDATLKTPGKILRSEFVDGLNVSDRLAKPKLRTERDHHYARLMHAGMPSTLETIDKATGAFSVEMRFPFWDKRLAEFCLALPPEQKLHKGWSRMVMRRAMNGILPKEIQWRGGKTDMHPSFEKGFLSHERDRMNQILIDCSPLIEKYVDTEVLRSACDRYHNNQASRKEVNEIWNALSLALWLQHAEISC